MILNKVKIFPCRFKQSRPCGRHGIQDKFYFFHKSFLRHYATRTMCGISSSRASLYSTLKQTLPRRRNNYGYSNSLLDHKMNEHQNIPSSLKFFSYQGHSGVFMGYDLSSPQCNVTHTIASRVGTNLHLKSRHPLNTIKNIIQNHWQKIESFNIHDNLDPIVPVFKNFDSLLIESDHVSRSKSDTYYLDNETVLRTHTSAHQTSLLASGEDRFLVTGDVYRRDEVDISHYPIFHQMEGVKMFNDEDFRNFGAHNLNDKVKIVEDDLKSGLTDMISVLFGDVEMRWVEAHFPFTEPSFELEILFNNEWLEVLGCGVVHKDIIKAVGRGDQLGWAFGLGLERLAMVLFSIPDIRLFWTEDKRFHKQFESGEIITFQPYSKYPPCTKDISFWISMEGQDSTFHPNDLNQIVRDVAGDLVERVELIDEFIHPKTGRKSNCFRISYRSMDKSLTNEEIDVLQGQVRFLITSKLGLEIR